MPDNGSDRGDYLFSGVTFRSPLDILEGVTEKKLATLAELGEDDRRELYRRAAELARDALARSLKHEV